MATGRERWLKARTLEDLGELTAQWLEGRFTFLPAYGADAPSAETEGLIEYLAAYNRAGYFTTESQPGIPLDESGGGQRAFVSGFATQATVDTVQAAILKTRLVALITPPVPPPGWKTPYRFPVTIEEGYPYTSMGLPHKPSDLVHFYEDDCPLAVDTILNAVQLDLYDPEWGDNTLLWETLAHALLK